MHSALVYGDLKVHWWIHNQVSFSCRERWKYRSMYAAAKIDPSASWLSRALNILQKYISWTTAISAIILLNQFDREIFLLWQYQQARFQIRLAGIQDWNWSLLWGGSFKNEFPFEPQPHIEEFMRKMSNHINSLLQCLFFNILSAWMTTDLG